MLDARDHISLHHGHQERILCETFVELAVCSNKRLAVLSGLLGMGPLSSQREVLVELAVEIEQDIRARRL